MHTQAMMERFLPLHKRVLSLNTTVIVQDYSSIMPFSEGLARAYTLSGDSASSVCKQNRQAALQV